MIAFNPAKLDIDLSNRQLEQIDPMLVDYGSDSEAGSPPPPAVKASLASLEDPVSDGDEGEVDPTDGFGIANLSKEEQAAVAGTSSKAVAIKSAPDVVVNVSQIESRLTEA